MPVPSILIWWPGLASYQIFHLTSNKVVELRPYLQINQLKDVILIKHLLIATYRRRKQSQQALTARLQRELSSIEVISCGSHGKTSIE
jgi:hypothetical protein